MSKNNKNYLKTEFEAVSENESLARMLVSAFICAANPTLEEMADVKTAVSEAVTNCIVHAYDEKGGKICMDCSLEDAGESGRRLSLDITDQGIGIKDIKKAMEPLYTTKPDLDRQGMGFAFMEAFMDELKVVSEPGKGTTVHMEKIIGE